MLVTFLIFLLPFNALLWSFFTDPNYDTFHKEQASLETPKSSANNIVDKVYTFLTPKDSLEFTDMILKKDISYYIFVQVVTPHDCILNLTLRDPQGGWFELFFRPMSFNNQSYGHSSAEIPFGTAFAGNYTFNFEVSLEFNMNIYIRITEDIAVLQDKIASNEWNNRIFYRVARFTDGMYMEHNIQMDRDTNYKVYLARVSPIAIENFSQVLVNHSLIDGNGVEFILYSDALLAGAIDVIFYTFGTAIAGVYSLKLEIGCQVDYVNIAYTVIDLYDISEGEDTNHTGEPTNHTTYESGMFNIPPLMLLTLTVGIVSIVSLLGVLIYHRKSTQSKAFDMADY